MTGRPARTELLADSDQRRLFGAFRSSRRRGAPCAVLDHDWPAGLRHAAVEDVAAAERAGRLRRGDLVVFTSGATGRPRAVHRDAASWVDSAEAFTAFSGIRAGERVLLDGPLASSLYLFGAWHADAVGAVPVFAGEDDAAAVVAHAVPARIAGLLQRRARGELPVLRTLVVAGDRVPAALRDAAAAAGVGLREYYGAAELSFVGARRDGGPMRAFPGVEVRLREGLIWSRSPYQAHGYLGGDGPLRRDAAGWATVGDLGRERPGGVGPGGFDVVGRAGAAVTTGGHTVVAEDVEAFLRCVPGVRDAAVLGVAHPRLGQRLVAVVAGEAGDEQLRAAVARLPRPARPRGWTRVPELPRTRGGKLRRNAVARLVDATDAVRVVRAAPPDAANDGRTGRSEDRDDRA